jgi:hypothetical protein
MATTFDMQPPPSKPGAKPQAGFSTEGVPNYMTQTPNAQMPKPTEATYTATEGFSDSGVSSVMVNVDTARAGNDVGPTEVGDIPDVQD